MAGLLPGDAYGCSWLVYRFYHLSLLKPVALARHSPLSVHPVRSAPRLLSPQALPALQLERP